MYAFDSFGRGRLAPTPTTTTPHANQPHARTHDARHAAYAIDYQQQGGFASPRTHRDGVVEESSPSLGQTDSAREYHAALTDRPHDHTDAPLLRASSRFHAHDDAPHAALDDSLVEHDVSVSSSGGVQPTETSPRPHTHRSFAPTTTDSDAAYRTNQIPPENHAPVPTLPLWPTLVTPPTLPPASASSSAAAAAFTSAHVTRPITPSGPMVPITSLPSDIGLPPLPGHLGDLSLLQEEFLRLRGKLTALQDEGAQRVASLRAEHAEELRALVDQQRAENGAWQERQTKMFLEWQRHMQANLHGADSQPLPTSHTPATTTPFPPTDFAPSHALTSLAASLTASQSEVQALRQRLDDLLLSGAAAADKPEDHPDEEEPPNETPTLLTTATTVPATTTNLDATLEESQSSTSKQVAREEVASPDTARSEPSADAARLVTLQSLLTQRSAEASTLSAQLTDAHRDAAVARDEVDALRRALSEAQRTLVQLRSERDDATAALDDAREESTSATEVLSALERSTRAAERSTKEREAKYKSELAFYGSTYTDLQHRFDALLTEREADTHKFQEELARARETAEAQYEKYEAEIALITAEANTRSFAAMAAQADRDAAAQIEATKQEARVESLRADAAVQDARAAAALRVVEEEVTRRAEEQARLRFATARRRVGARLLARVSDTRRREMLLRALHAWSTRAQTARTTDEYLSGLREGLEGNPTRLAAKLRDRHQHVRPRRDEGHDVAAAAAAASYAQPTVGSRARSVSPLPSRGSPRPSFSSPSSRFTASPPAPPSSASGVAFARRLGVEKIRAFEHRREVRELAQGFGTWRTFATRARWAAANRATVLAERDHAERARERERLRQEQERVRERERERLATLLASPTPPPPSATAAVTTNGTPAPVPYGTAPTFLAPHPTITATAGFASPAPIHAPPSPAARLTPRLTAPAVAAASNGVIVADPYDTGMRTNTGAPPPSTPQAPWHQPQFQSPQMQMHPQMQQHFQASPPPQQQQQQPQQANVLSPTSQMRAFLDSPSPVENAADPFHASLLAAQELASRFLTTDAGGQVAEMPTQQQSQTPQFQPQQQPPVQLHYQQPPPLSMASPRSFSMPLSPPSSHRSSPPASVSGSTPAAASLSTGVDVGLELRHLLLLQQHELILEHQKQLNQSKAATVLRQQQEIDQLQQQANGRRPPMIPPQTTTTTPSLTPMPPSPAVRAAESTASFVPALRVRTDAEFTSQPRTPAPRILAGPPPSPSPNPHPSSGMATIAANDAMNSTSTTRLLDPHALAANNRLTIRVPSTPPHAAIPRPQPVLHTRSASKSRSTASSASNRDDEGPFIYTPPQPTTSARPVSTTRKAPLDQGRPRRR